MGATIRDVAREAGVSPATVSRVFNRRELVNVATYDHIMSVAQRLHYVPNASARSLSVRRSRVLGLILPLPYNEFFAGLVHGTDEAAIRAKYNLMIATSHNDLNATLAGIHMSTIPPLDYALLWRERSLRSVANMTRRDAEESLAPGTRAATARPSANGIR